MSKLWASLAISASAALIFSSASYFWIFCRSSISLLVGVLDLLQVVAVRRLVHLELLLVGRELGLRLLQLQRELRRRRAIAGLQVRLRLGLELLHVRPVGGDLTRDALDEAAILLEARRGLP